MFAIGTMAEGSVCKDCGKDLSGITGIDFGTFDRCLECQEIRILKEDKWVE